MNKNIIIAIDGCSSTGKSTIAKALAKSLHYIYIDSGAMYRAVTLYALDNGYIQNDKIDTTRLERSMSQINITFTMGDKGDPITLLNGRSVENEIRTPRVSKWVSPISTLAFVRKSLTAQQQEFGKRRGIVMDGRDIGTTVFPDAELKIFLTASPEIRAKRRFEEMKSKGQQVSLEDVLQSLLERDRIDSSRAISPLVKAQDAIDFDNSFLTREEQDEKLLQIAHQVIAKVSK